MESWIPLKKVQAVVQPDILFLMLAAAFSSWLIYRLFCRAISPERHKNLKALFSNLTLHCVNLLGLCAAFWALSQVSNDVFPVQRLLPYVGFAAVLWGCTVFVKTCRIYAFEYLFLSNMHVGVPLLIVNMLTVTLSIILGTWILSGIFEFHLAPLLATSAVFSIVLGLALQDTLGNMIAGVALQLDKPYEIGDWIEIGVPGSSRWVGQVYEITWRATLLINTTEEWITIPNRTIAQAEVSNFSAKIRPFIRGHFFRIPYGQPIEKVKDALMRAVAEVPSVRRLPAPMVLIMETTESWVSYKLIYYIDDYGRQFIIGDEVIEKCLVNLQSGGIPIASQRIALSRDTMY